MRKVPIGAVVQQDVEIVGEQWFDEMFYKNQEVYDYSKIIDGKVELFFHYGSTIVPETELVGIR